MSLAQVLRVLLPATAALACVASPCDARTIEFAGIAWKVKKGNGLGPGPNLWSDSARNVWVDSDGLHLRITRKSGKWYCAEVWTDRVADYGVLRFYLVGRPDQFDRNVVGGFFLYRDDNREIDIEFARWSQPNPGYNAQYVIQPPPQAPGQYGAGNMHRFLMALNGTFTTHTIDWRAGRVAFRSLHGHFVDPPAPEFVIAEKELAGYQGYVPKTADALHPHINLWLVGGKPPFDGQEAEITIKAMDLALVPLAPKSVKATDGAFADKVSVAWTPSVGAAGYEVWRGTAKDPALAERIADAVAGTAFDDAPADLGTRYRYWVKAVGSGGAPSGFSPSDLGWKSRAVITSCPAAVAPGETVTVQWVVAGAKPTSHNHVQWWVEGPNPTVTSLAKVRSAPYQSRFAAPPSPCTLCVQVHAVISGGASKGEYSEIRRIAVE